MVLNLRGNRVIPVIKLPNQFCTLPLLDALKAGGITVAEITYRSAYAPQAIRLGRAERPEILVGAGTVVNASQCAEAISMGAQFIVSPGFSKEVAKICRDADIPLIPGCVTPTEITAALDEGIEILKFFPAGQYGGVGTLKAFSAPFSGVKFIPTGGVNINNLKDYLSLPNVVACGGSWLTESKDLEQENWLRVTELAAQATEASR